MQWCCDVAALISKGWGTVLEEEDIPALNESHASRRNADQLKDAWRREQDDGSRPPALWRACGELVQWELLIGGLLSAANGISSTAARPLVLKAFVKAVNKGDSGDDSGYWLIPLFGAVVGVEMCCQALCRHIIGCDAAYRFHGAVSSVRFASLI